METQSCTCGVHVCKRFPYDHCALSKLATRTEANAAAAAWNAEIRCATCGEESGGKGSSMYGSVHKYGPVGHPFKATGDAR